MVPCEKLHLGRLREEGCFAFRLAPWGFGLSIDEGVWRVG